MILMIKNEGKAHQYSLSLKELPSTIPFIPQI
nr:MAG TPA: hypothetical protein [Caudoviricetes sp.]